MSVADSNRLSLASSFPTA